MNILFMTMVRVDVSKRDIYNDLMRKFRNEGHDVYIVCPIERKYGKNTYLSKEGGVHTLYVRTPNLEKTNIIEKGLGQLSIEYLFKNAIKTFFSQIKFHLILYSTPPITFPNVIKYVKKVNPAAISYLMLKDIFPQNAVDMGMLKKTGLKGLLYKFFRTKEKKLYALSDVIGCMSPANIRYVLKNNIDVVAGKVEICPNSIELDMGNHSNVTINDKYEIIKRYKLPIDRPIFIYGGNLGIPQGIPFLIECLDANANRADCHFVIVGSGTCYSMLENWYKTKAPQSVTLINGLPKEEYDNLVKICQIGLIFLDYRFTIPNFPSRVLSYLECKMPVICATDPNCDLGAIAEENNFGMWAPSNNVDAFTSCINKILMLDIKSLGENGYQYLIKNYLVENTYNAIVKHIH